MGGGGVIPYEKVITMNVPQSGYKNFWDDYKGRDTNKNGRLDSDEVIINPNDGKPFFSHHRSTIFRYTIICHTYGTNKNVNGKVVFTALGKSDGLYGVNDPDGNDDILILGIMNENEITMGSTFMHELGNDLGLQDNYDDAKTCMNPNVDYIGYRAWEWRTLDLSLVTKIGGG